MSRITISNARIAVITCRITKQQNERVLEKAKTYGISKSEYIRALLLGEPLRPEIDRKVIGELRRLGGLLKHVHNESNGAYSDLTAKAIKELNDYVSLLRQDHLKQVDKIKEKLLQNASENEDD